MSNKLLKHNHSHISHSEAETISLAQQFAKGLKAGDIVLLQGDLGAGKTTFVKGVALGLKVGSKSVVSPTFVLMNHYDGKLPIYHFDLYRLENPKELNTVQFDEYFYGAGVSLIEWPERLGANAPQHYYLVELSHQDEHTRKICISSH